MSYHNGDSSSSSSSPQRIAAPPGFHYMPDGSLMADSEMNAQQRVMGTDDPIMNPQREPCVQQMSCAPGYYWSQRHCNCMTNEELTGPYDFGGPRLANPNESNEVEINRRNAQGQTAPDGFHYMPDGTLMSDAEHAAKSSYNNEIGCSDASADDWAKVSGVADTSKTPPAQPMGGSLGSSGVEYNYRYKSQSPSLGSNWNHNPATLGNMTSSSLPNPMFYANLYYVWPQHSSFQKNVIGDRFISWFQNITDARGNGFGGVSVGQLWEITAYDQFEVLQGAWTYIIQHVQGCATGSSSCARYITAKLKSQTQIINGQTQVLLWDPSNTSPVGSNSPTNKLHYLKITINGGYPAPGNFANTVNLSNYLGIGVNNRTLPGQNVNMDWSFSCNPCQNQFGGCNHEWLAEYTPSNTTLFATQGLCLTYCGTGSSIPTTWDCVTTTPNIGEVSPDNLFNTFGGISQCVERFTPQVGAFPTQQACVASCGSGGPINTPVGPLPKLTNKVGNPGGIIKKVTKRGNKKIDGWVLTPSGSYITEAVFQETYGDRLEKVITKFKLNLADLTATTETRSLEIIGDHGASFILEIKNAAGNYYNFYTKTFASTHSFLDEELYGGSYINEVVFPASGSDDQYDVFLHAKPGTKHISYIEKRFGDNSIDLNGSIGSNSLLLQKVIYQYNSKLTLTLSGYSASGDITATMGTTSLEIDRYKEGEDTAFSFTTTAAPTAAFRVLKQPLEEDVLSFIQPTLASVPATLQGENIYPTVTGTDTVNMAGGRSSSGVAITMDSAVATKMAVGDRVTGNAALNAGVFTVVSLDSTNVFSISSGVAINDNETLSFSNQVNHSWPVNNFVNLIQEGMILAPGTNVPANTTVKAYSDKTTTSLGTKEERTRVSKILPAVSTKGLKPTVVKGLVTTQAGDITFSNQLPLSLGGTAMKIGGYGESEALRLYGWDIQFTDLEITLTPPTTTTREASAGGSSADIDVNSKEGVINNVSRVSGVGINPALQNPLITAGGGATGTGDWTMDAAQTLENGTILTVENTSRVATITGNIRINRAGNASQILRFDVDKLLSTSA